MVLNTASPLGERTLVLNRSWIAITTTTVRRALSLLYVEAAQVICPRTYETHDFDSWLELPPEYGDPVVRTVRQEVKVPEIIVLRGFDGRPRRNVAFSRRNLYRRDDYTCHYCGRRPRSDQLTIDHVVPRSLGGRTTWENCVVACEDCNKRKGNRPPGSGGMKLVRVPRAPKWSWELELSLGGGRDSWERFLPRNRRNGNGKTNGNGHGNGKSNGHARGG